MKIKVLSYNIHKGFNFSGAGFILEQIRQALRATGADILFLQEVVGENKKHQKNIATWPTQPQFEYLADENWAHFSYGKNAIFPVRHHGNAILSQFPLLSEHNLNISMNRLEQRGLLHTQIVVQGKTRLHLLNTHIDLLAASRRKQMLKISDYVLKNIPKDEAFLFCGDFNDWDQKISQIVLEQLGAKDCFENLHGRPAKSFPSFYPLLTLDRMYFRGGLKPVSCKVIREKPWISLSDHLPLLAEFELL